MNTPKLPPLPKVEHSIKVKSAAGQEWQYPAYSEADMQAYAIAAIKAQGVPDGWQPIDSAPKDGTTVLLATPKGRIADGMWHQKCGVWSWPYVMVEPTHWRPLPATPGASAPPAPQAKPQPITEQELKAGREAVTDDPDEQPDPWSFRMGVCFAERHHKIKE